MSRFKLTLILMGILMLALALRLWGVGFGLPYAYHFDEPTYVSAALNLGAGIIGRQSNPTGFYNILFGEYAVYFIIGRIVGLFASAADFERAYRADPTMFLLLGRLTSVLLGTLNVWVVYQLGKVLVSRIAGLLAAFFLAIAFLHVRDSHYGVPDIAMAFFVSLCVMLCVLAVKRSSRWYPFLAAAACGFAFAVKWSAWPLAITLALTLFFRWRAQAGTGQTGHASLEMLLGLAFFVVGLVVGGFQLLLKPALYLNYALHELRAGEGGGFGIWQIDTVTGWHFYLKTLGYGLGSALLAVALLGCLIHLVQVVRTRDKTSILLLSFPLLYYLLMGASRHYFARYALPLVPFAALFAAEAIMALPTMLVSRRVGLGTGVAVLLAVAAIVQPLAWDVQHDLLLTRQDTRTLAKTWIEANLPEGSKIAVDWPVHGPPLSTPERMVPHSDKVYDVVSIGGLGLADHSLQWYKEQGFDYLIASSFISDLSVVDKNLDMERRKFYISLDQELTLLREFRPYTGDTEPPFIFDEIYGPAISLWQRNRPGPSLKVYKLK
jgi:4-amino-4-deoxy-L-arabinose transferase-like glycosyltransferase